MTQVLSYAKEWLPIIVPILTLIVLILGYILNKKVFTQDKSDLRIMLEYYPETGLGTSFLVRLYNKGRRPVTVQEVLVCFYSGNQVAYSGLKRKIIQLPEKLPLILQETYMGEYLFPLHFMKDFTRSPLDLKRVLVVDTIGRKYSFPNNSLLSHMKFLKLRKSMRIFI